MNLPCSLLRRNFLQGFLVLLAAAVSAAFFRRKTGFCLQRCAQAKPLHTDSIKIVGQGRAIEFRSL